MENYIVSARKYRPSTFETVVGQEALTQTLRNAIRSNRLAHAYLFCGPRGVGKTTCARIFAKTINCEHLTADYDACNECESCRSFNEQRSFNIHELDAASNNSVEDIRSLIDQTRIPPQTGKYSVYIIDEVHMLSTGAFNALLKTLEEPPSYAIFILATTEKQKILPTILSRCQVYDFARITVMDIIRYLQYVAKQEGISVDEETLNVVAQKADGGMRDALSIFDQLAAFCQNRITYEKTLAVLNVLDTEYYFRLVDLALAGNATEALLLLNEVLLKGFDAGNFVVGFAKHLRDLLVGKDAAAISLIESSAAVREHYREQAARCPIRWIYKAMELMNNCDINSRQAHNKRLTVELALVQLTQLNAPAEEAQPVRETAQPKAHAPKAPASKPSPTPATTPVSAPNPAPTPAPAKTADSAAPASPKIPSKPSIGKLPTVGNVGLIAPDTPPTPQTAEKETPKRDNPFTLDQLRDAWVGLKGYFPREERLQAMLLGNTPELTDTSVCCVKVVNPWQKQELERFAPSILRMLRERLQNDTITLQVDIAQYEKDERAYTAAEKYKLLLKINPHLKDLRDRLNLQLQ